MKTKPFENFTTYLVIWSIIVFVTGVCIHGRVTNDGQWNHAESYASLKEDGILSVSTWVAYAFWVPVDTVESRTSDPDGYDTSTDMFTKVIFMGLLSIWIYTCIKYFKASVKREKLIAMWVLLFMNNWLLWETIILVKHNIILY